MIPAHRNLFWKQAGFTPNPAQAVILDDPHRFIELAGGEVGLTGTNLFGPPHQEFPRGDEIARRVLLTLHYAF